ncbi:MAG: 30S ribosomal protein S4 [Clostridiaceae bacterium]|nr:30S ribosomal protein S4 [Clostridiaceae bacterium]
MATRRGPRFKECRRLGVNVCGHSKAMNRTVRRTGRTSKKSEYGLQLNEKQKVKAYYGIFERQMENYFAKATRSRKGTPGEVLLITLERRLDNMVYRAGFANSIRGARQMVNHRHILVNDKVVNIPSYLLKPGDKLTLSEGSRNVPIYVDHFTSDSHFVLPYIEVDRENFSAVFTRLPERDELPIEVNEQLVVEYYSR